MWKIELTVSTDHITAAEEAIYMYADSLGTGEFPTISDFEITEDLSVRLVEAFFNTQPSAENVLIELKKWLSEGDFSDLKVTEIEEKNWVAESQKLLSPIDTGAFFVFGSHDADQKKADRINLQIDAGQAFGTGQHETTHGCLEAINDLKDMISPKVVLDLGCGSGLLAFAMAKIWSKARIIASDIDPIATETTLQNAAINDIDLSAASLTALTSDGFEDPALSGHGPYDVIAANILAGPLIDLAPEMVENLTRDGHLILSGLLITQQEKVMAAYTEQGLKLVKEYHRGDWSALHLSR